MLGAAGAVEMAICAKAIHKPPDQHPDPLCRSGLRANIAREMTSPPPFNNSFGFGGHNASIVVKKFLANSRLLEVPAWLPQRLPLLERIPFRSAGWTLISAMNRVALITGASRGIGRGIALELARFGYDLIINFAGTRRRRQTAADCVARPRSRPQKPR